MKASIVINTYNRADFLKRTLQSFRYLEDSEFEVIVVNGPSTDHTQSVLEEFKGEIISANCPEPNLSISRNIGIQNSVGDVVVFIDDDGIPEPEWLVRLLKPYENPEVAAVGGFAYDHTGYSFQARYLIQNRFGYHEHSSEDPGVDSLCYPGTERFPGIIGVNSSFRRSQLVEVGGFDEWYAYFLDETDVVIRLIDAGYKISVVPDAYVHHKGAPSTQRRYYLYCRSQAYFMCLNALKVHGAERIQHELEKLRDEKFGEIENYIAAIGLTDEHRQAGRAEIEKGLIDGIERAKTQGSRALLNSKEPLRKESDFLKFKTFKNQKRLKICFVSQEYPPVSGGGIGRWTNEMASGLASRGHDVHVISHSGGGDTVDYEQCVWVHRIAAQLSQESFPVELPRWISARAATVKKEYLRIQEHHKLDGVISPIYDLEGIGILNENNHYITLETTLAISEESNLDWEKNEQFMNNHVRPIILGEKYAIQNAKKLLTISNGMLKAAERVYGLSNLQEKSVHVPIGISDQSKFFKRNRSDNLVRVLFVGRFEVRKGIDLLLEVIPGLLRDHTNLHFCLVGDSTLPGPRGTPYIDEFYAAYKNEDFLNRLVVPGKVSSEELYQLYADSDIFVAPSRFESFGIIFLEAMMFALPPIASNAGGMPEIIHHNETGLIVEPGNALDLKSAIVQLINSPDLRKNMGQASRSRYEREFSSSMMLDRLEGLFKNSSEGSKTLNPRASDLLA